jgi:phospholipid transport system substrate-binding protein
MVRWEISSVTSVAEIGMATRRLALSPAAALLVIASSVIGSASAQEAPDVLIRRVGQGFLGAVGNAPANTRQDQGRILGLVEETMLPYVDFQRSTSLTTGRYWRNATLDQQKQLTNQFRSVILSSIVSAVSRGPYDRIDVEPSHDDPTIENVDIRARVVRRNGAPVALIYRMGRTSAGWKVDDVSVSGAWLAQSYGPLFASEINKGGIDGLIMTLTKRNRQLGETFRR